MPVYEFVCYEDNVTKEEIRKIGDYTPPKCSICLNVMERIFSSNVTVIDPSKVPAKLKKRSEDQGKKFFKRHHDYQNMVSETLKNKGD